MAILGVYEGHNAGAALISADGTVLAAVEEERFSRVKNHDARPPDAPGPVRSVAWCLAAATEEVTAIAVGLEEPEALHRRAVNTFLDLVAAGERQRLDRRHQLGLDAHDLLQMPLLTQRARVAKALRTVAEAGLDPAGIPTMFVPHHTCHAAAFLLAPVDAALVVTLDGKGDDLSGSVHDGQGHRLGPVAEVPTEASLGHLYSAATVACGLRPQRDEGKLTAMAASGTADPRLLKRLSAVMRFDPAAGVPRGSLGAGIVQGPYPDRIPGFHNERMAGLIAGLDRCDVAATVQQILEQVVVEFVEHHLRRSGSSALVVSGGVFANVTLNRRLAGLPGVQELHVHPGMTDSGIALGAAAVVHARTTGARPRPLNRIDLGPSFADDAAAAAFREQGYEVVAAAEGPERALAAALADGHVVARFAGGCEYGPRALGHRSVLAPAGDPSVAAALNDRLRRSHVMPFAPVVPAAEAHRLFDGLEPVAGPTRFMTTSVRCRPEALAALPAAVHLDGTARPQLVHPGENPRLALLLEEYRRRTGRPGLVNTSFNLHDEPIVCTPTDAARSARAAGIAVVQVGDLVCAYGAESRSRSR
ncbi:carbamoyltransferase C-terminal domain-containing protein [Dactylosporangium sp. CS-047395]|uniref:carbamoyltransferase C-terminal domain-containing protein n=1 Tax=Dactylosporangium sp. CS-047395 TaxID=3239936 RepID=UPI003D8C846F